MWRKIESIHTSQRRRRTLKGTLFHSWTDINRSDSPVTQLLCASWSVRSYDFTFKSPRAGSEMFGNFNSSGSCFKKKKRKGGFIYSMYPKIRWPQIKCLRRRRSTFLAPSSPPPPSAHPPPRWNSHLMPVSQAPPFSTSKPLFQIFLLTTPFTSRRTDAGSTLWGNIN